MKSIRVDTNLNLVFQSQKKINTAEIFFPNKIIPIENISNNNLINFKFNYLDIVDNLTNLKYFFIKIDHGDEISLYSLDFSDFEKSFVKTGLIDKMSNRFDGYPWEAIKLIHIGPVIEVDFALANFSEVNFEIRCDNNSPIYSFVTKSDNPFTQSCWFLGSKRLRSIKCFYILSNSSEFLKFELYVDGKKSDKFMPIYNFSRSYQFNNIPEIERIRRISGPIADNNSFINHGKTAFERINSLSLKHMKKTFEAHGAILDWGAGCGRVLRHFKYNSKVIVNGIDIDADNISWINKNLPFESFAVELDPPTDLPSKFYNLIYSCSVLSHLTEKDSLKWLIELKRILKPTGKAFISFNGSATSIMYCSRNLENLKDVLNDKIFDKEINNDLKGFIPSNDYYRASFSSTEYWINIFSKVFNNVKIEYSVVSGGQHIAVLSNK